MGGVGPRNFCNAILGFESQNGPPSQLRRYGATDFACRDSLRLGQPSAASAPTCLPRRSSAKPSEVWLAVRDDFRNWLVSAA